MVGRNRPGLDAGDVAGFAAEVALDPLTYLTFGASALSKSGKVAKAAGLLPKADIAGTALKAGRREQLVTSTLDDVLKGLPDTAQSASKVQDMERAAGAMGTTLDQLRLSGETLGGLGRYHVPGMVDVTFGRSRELAKKLDRLGHRLRYSPVGTGLARAFSVPARGMKTVLGQLEGTRSLSREVSQTQAIKSQQVLGREMLERAGLNDPDGWTDTLATMDGTYRLTDEESAAMRSALDRGQQVEDVFVPDFDEAFNRNLMPKLQDKLDRKLMSPEDVDSLKGMLRQEYEQNQELLTEMKRLGLDPREHADPTILYAARQHGRRPDYLGPRGGKPFKTTSAFDFSRLQFLKRLLPSTEGPGGGAMVERIVRDPKIVGTQLEAGEKFRNFMATRAARARGYPGATVYQPVRTDVDALKKEMLDSEAFSQAEIDAAFPDVLEAAERPQHVFEKYLMGSQSQLDRLDELNKQVTDLAEMRAADVPDEDAIEALSKVVNDGKAEREGLSARWQQAQQIADWAGRREIPPAGELFWNRHVLDAQALRKIADVQRIEGTSAFYRLGAGAAERGEGERLLSFIEKQGKGIKDTDTAVARMAEQLSSRADELGLDAQAIENLSEGMDGYRVRVAEVVDDVDEIERAARDAWEADRSSVFDELTIAPKVAEDMGRAMAHWNPTKESAGWLKRAYDGYNNVFRALVTAPFPAFHVRNATTAFWQQLVTGSYDPRLGKLNPLAYVRPLQDGVEFAVKGKLPKNWKSHPWLKGLNERQAMEKLRADFYAYRVSEPHANIGHVTLGETEVTRNVPDVLESLPGHRKPHVKFGFWEQLNPASVRGGFGAGAKKAEHIGSDPFLLTRLGRVAGNTVEDTNRFATWWAQGLQGASPEVAAGISRGAHVDYRLMTDMERNVWKRLIPFWQFSRHMIPFQLSQLAHKPGGLVAQTIRAANRMRGEGFVPEHVGAGLAIPFGEGAEGKQRFITGIDLPHEQLNDILRLRHLDTSSPGGLVTSAVGSVSETGKALLGQTTPLLKGPVEEITGRQFYSGRDLRDLDSRIGRMIQTATRSETQPYVPQALDQLLANTPAARALSSGGRALDAIMTPERRESSLTQLLTGVRMKDVDTERAQRMAAKDRLIEMLRPRPDVRVYEKLYVPAAQRELLDDETRRRVELYNRLMR